MWWFNTHVLRANSFEEEMDSHIFRNVYSDLYTCTMVWLRIQCLGHTFFVAFEGTAPMLFRVDYFFADIWGQPAYVLIIDMITMSVDSEDSSH